MKITTYNEHYSAPFLRALVESASPSLLGRGEPTTLCNHVAKLVRFRCAKMNLGGYRVLPGPWPHFECLTLLSDDWCRFRPCCIACAELPLNHHSFQDLIAALQCLLRVFVW